MRADVKNKNMFIVVGACCEEHERGMMVRRSRDRVDRGALGRTCAWSCVVCGDRKWEDESWTGV